MTTLYQPKEAADALGVSSAALRKYGDVYARHLSTEATTIPRNFTPGDLRLLAYVAQCTRQGQQHKDILARLDTGDPDFAAFEFAPPAQQEDPPSTALAHVAQLHAAQALLQDAQRREQEAQAKLEARERELLDQVGALRQALGKAEGRLEAFEAAQTTQRRSWWARMFGSGE